MAYEISKYLAHRGHNVTVYTTDVYDSISRLKYRENPTFVDGIKVYHFKNISNILAKKNFPIAPMMAISLYENIQNFDIIHINEYRTFQSVLVHYFAKKYKIPYVLQPRGSVPQKIGAHNLKVLFDDLFGLSIFNDTHRVILSSNKELQECISILPNLNKDKVELIPNGIDLDNDSNLPNKGEFRKKYLIKNNEKIILALGRIHEIKGFDLLIESFNILCAKIGNVKLVIAGPDEGYLSVLCSIVDKLNLNDKVIFTGPLYGNDKIEAYIDANIFVLPSRYESFGNVVLEACKFGLPPVITNNCGVSEWITNDQGMVVEYDKNELYASMYKLLINEELRIKMGENCKKLIFDKFSLDNVFGKLENVYVRVNKANIQ